MDNYTEQDLENMLRVKREGRVSKEKETSFTKKMVSFIVLINVLFTTAVLFIFLRVGSEPSILIGAWFAFTTGELWLMASIKKTEVKEEDCYDGLD